MFGLSSRASSGISVEAMCRPLGWGIDERDGNSSTLYFKGDGVTPRREVIVTHGRGGELMTFGAPCRATYPQHGLPEGLPAALLMRSGQGLGHWYATELRSGDVGFICRFVALAAAMTPRRFQLICSTLLDEVAAIEIGLHRKGLL